MNYKRGRTFARPLKLLCIGALLSALDLETVCNALDGDEEGRAAHLHVVLLSVVPNSLEVVLHDRDETVVVFFLGPEESGEVLYPLKV